MGGRGAKDELFRSTNTPIALTSRDENSQRTVFSLLVSLIFHSSSGRQASNSKQLSFWTDAAYLSSLPISLPCLHQQECKHTEANDSSRSQLLSTFITGCYFVRTGDPSVMQGRTNGIECVKSAQTADSDGRRRGGRAKGLHKLDEMSRCGSNFSDRMARS